MVPAGQAKAKGVRDARGLRCPSKAETTVSPPALPRPSRALQAHRPGSGTPNLGTHWLRRGLLLAWWQAPLSGLAPHLERPAALISRLAWREPCGWGLIDTRWPLPRGRLGGGSAGARGSKQGQGGCTQAWPVQASPGEIRAVRQPLATPPLLACRPPPSHTQPGFPRL